MGVVVYYSEIKFRCANTFPKKLDSRRFVTLSGFGALATHLEISADPFLSFPSIVNTYYILTAVSNENLMKFGLD